MFIFIVSLTALLSTLLALSASFFKNKRTRYILVTFISLLLSVVLIFRLAAGFSWVYLALAPICALQIFNIFRIAPLRYEQNTIKRVFFSGLFLLPAFLLIEMLTLMNLSIVSKGKYLLSALVFVAGLLAIYSIKKNSYRFKNLTAVSDENLPTVSVLIPARDEDTQLADCIESVLASDYPKLEVIVLDDCSQDKSSAIIKSFAHRGVRFIQGEEPKENWLAKNQAYETLKQSASGDWYLFMGVDVRLNKSTIRNLISGALNKKLLMVGLLPTFYSPSISSIAFPLRFYWELALPFFIMNHPPAVSTCWLVHDEALASCGGFGAVSQSVLPERYFALKMMAISKYKFIRSSEDLYLSTTKSHRDQLDTSERLLYPQLKKSVPRLLAMSLLVAVSIYQYTMAIYALINKDYVAFVIYFASLLPMLISQVIVSNFQGMQYKIIRTLLMPILLVQELTLAYISAFRYEFSEVLWKGRNVCYPLLKAIPKLPNI